MYSTADRAITRAVAGGIHRPAAARTPMRRRIPVMVRRSVGPAGLCGRRVALGGAMAVMASLLEFDRGGCGGERSPTIGGDPTAEEEEPRDGRERVGDDEDGELSQPAGLRRERAEQTHRGRRDGERDREG